MTGIASTSLHKYTSYIGTYVSTAAAIARTNYVGANTSIQSWCGNC